MSYVNTIKEFIVDNFLYGDGDQLTEDTSFLERGIIDSTGIIEVVSFLEEHFKITIADEELIPENLDSLKNIDSFLQKKLDNKT